jgi:hypothetical protein
MKQCTRCGVSKAAEFFYKNVSAEDGFTSACKACLAAYQKSVRDKSKSSHPPGWKKKTADAAAYAREYRAANIEKIRAADRARPYDPVKERAKYERKMKRLRGKDYVVGRAQSQLSAEELAIRRKARTAYKTALKRGKLQRLPCMVCGDVEADGHHPDYSKPLDVVWLCGPHHVETHKIT